MELTEEVKVLLLKTAKDGFRLRGRKRSEDHLPNLLRDITAIVDGKAARRIRSFARRASIRG